MLKKRGKAVIKPESSIYMENANQAICIEFVNPLYRRKTGTSKKSIAQDLHKLYFSLSEPEKLIKDIEVMRSKSGNDYNIA